MRVLSAFFGIIVGVFVGFGMAWYGVKTEILIDYDSGNVRRVTKVGPFTVRTDDSFSPAFNSGGGFGSIRMDHGKTGLTGEAHWHTALVFPRDSKVSPSLEGGAALSLMNRLQTAIRVRGIEKPGAMKSEFLKALAGGGPRAAGKVVEEAETKND